MKNFSQLLIGLSLLMFGTTSFSQSRTDNPQSVPAIQSGGETVKVASSPELYSLVTNWVTDFSQSNPQAKIELTRTNDAIAQLPGNLSLLSDESLNASNDQSAWRMVIGRDVVVPIMNAKNPMLDLVNQQGISSKKFASLLTQVGPKNWSAILKGGQDAGLQLIIPNDPTVKAGLTEFAKVNLAAGSENFSSTTNDVIAAVQKNVFAIGFCRLNDLKALPENIKLLPIDKNGNGRIDNFEKIYGNVSEFTQGVWIGKYPAALSKNIYAVATVKPTAQSELAFLAWILADGQNSLKSNGYCVLTSSEKQSNLASLIGGVESDNGTGNVNSPQSWPVALTVVLLVGLFIAIFYYARKRASARQEEKEIQIAPLLIENVIDIPKGLYFDRTHTWAFMEQDGNVRVGLDDFLPHVTGKLTKIRMREVGELVRKGEVLMTVMHEGKQLNIYAPISGTILEQNELLISDTALVNSSPFYKGWVYQLEPKNWLRETQFMFMGQKYVEWIQDEFVRLKDFIAATVKTDKLAYAHVVLQDGGELTDNVLADMEPEVWEDFQTKFIDTSR